MTDQTQNTKVNKDDATNRDANKNSNPTNEQPNPQNQTDSDVKNFNK